jgi:hypothetical protein
VRARQSVWSDKKVQELLGSFVAVADEVGRLQHGTDAESRLFQGFCEQGHYGGRTEPTNTRQGIYAIAPSGRFLASINSTSPEQVARMLRTALDRWAQLPDDARLLSADELARLAASARFEDRCPTDGLVLAEYVRDLDRAVDERAVDKLDWRTRAWNQDQAWFTKAEAAALVPSDAAVGAAVAVPARLVERLARLHLVDTVRGQTPPFGKDAVLEATLRSEVQEVDGHSVHLRLSGRTRTQAKGTWKESDRGENQQSERGVRTELTGRAVWDRAAGRFTSFELLALGERFGATQYNQRADDTAPSRIGFLFVLAPKDHPRVAPAFWWDYDLR